MRKQRHREAEYFVQSHVVCDDTAVWMLVQLTVEPAS